MTDAETLLACRKMSPGIAEWIDAQVLKGAKPAAILRALKATVDLVRAGRELPDGRVE